MRNLKAIRLTKGWTRRSLAEACGVTAEYFSFLERGKRNARLKVAMSLARVLCCTLDDLVREDFKIAVFDEEAQNQCGYNVDFDVTTQKTLFIADCHFRFSVYISSAEEIDVAKQRAKEAFSSVAHNIIFKERKFPCH